MSDDWQMGPACYEETSEDDLEWLAPPNLGRDEGEFSGDDLDWQALEDTHSDQPGPKDAFKDAKEARPASGESIDIGNVQETAIFQANPFSYARQAAQQRARRHRSPTPPLVIASRVEQWLQPKPIEAAFARQRQRADGSERPIKAVKRPVKAIKPTEDEHPVLKRKQLSRTLTPIPVEPPLSCPSPPRLQRRWTPPTPSSLFRPPSLMFKEPISPPTFSRPLQDSPFRSPSPTCPPRPRGSPPKPTKSNFQLVQVYEPPPRTTPSLIPLPTVRAAGALTQKPARRMHRPFRSPASLRPTPYISRSEDSPFAGLNMARQTQTQDDAHGAETEEDPAQWTRM